MASRQSGDRVLMFFAGDFPEGMSNNARLKQLAAGFSGWGLKVELLSLFPSAYRSDPASPQGQWEHIPYRLLSGAAGYQTGLARAIQRFRGQLAAFRYLLGKRREIHFVYFYNPRFSDSLSSMLLARALRLPILVDQTERFSTLGHPAHRLEEWLLKRIPSLMCLISDRLMQAFGDARIPVHQLPIMVDAERFDIQQSARRHTVGYLGNFSWKDNLEQLVHGLSMARNQLPDIRLVLMGFDRNGTVEAWIRQQGHSEWVELVDRPTYDQIPNGLMRCDCLIINRTSDAFSSYGYPYKLGEYLASSRPVLVSDIEGFAGEFESGDLVFKYTADDPAALARAVKERYADQEEFDRMGERGRNYAIHTFQPSKVLTELKIAMIHAGFPLK